VCVCVCVRVCVDDVLQSYRSSDHLLQPEALALALSQPLQVPLAEQEDQGRFRVPSR
jgi:hypothetical protein